MLYFILPYLYSIFCILIPTYLLDNYLIGSLLLFWVTGFTLFSYLYDYLVSKELVRSLIILFFLMIPITVAWELFFMWTDAWYFDPTKLVGIELLKVPVEEFVFWWGASPCLILMFLYHLKKLDEIDDFKVFLEQMKNEVTP